MIAKPKQVAVTGGFDDLRSGHIRLLHEASRLGDLTVLLWSDETLRRRVGKPPKFAQAERGYLLQSIRYVRQVRLVEGPVPESAIPELPGFHPEIWVVDESEDSAVKRSACQTRGVQLRVLRPGDLDGFPEDPSGAGLKPARRKVVVTGCFDWFHSGHVRFFEEVAGFGDLYVVVGHDANIRLLKGQGHPRFPQEERRYVVQSVRFVQQARVSTGNGWLDAEPEIERLRPDIYAVNEDGDQPVKREYCKAHGIEYLVLKRTPAPGLPPRRSTDLRGC